MLFKKTKTILTLSLLAMSLAACSEQAESTLPSKVEFSKATTETEVEQAFNQVPFELSSMFSDVELSYISKEQEKELKEILENIFRAKDIKSVEDKLKKDLQGLDEKSKSIVFLGYINKVENELYTTTSGLGNQDFTNFLFEFMMDNKKIEEEEARKINDKNFQQVVDIVYSSNLAFYSRDGAVYIDLDSDRIFEAFGDSIPSDAKKYLEATKYTLMLELLKEDGNINYSNIKESVEKFLDLKKGNSIYQARYSGIFDSYFLYLIGFGTIYEPNKEVNYEPFKEVYKDILKSDSSLKKVLEPLINNLEENNYILKDEGQKILKDIAEKEIKENTFNQTFGSMQ